MPELHKLTPALGVLQDRGHRVALVTDGRMSGASGKVPAAIHCTPEAAAGGPLARLRDGDVVRVDADGRPARRRWSTTASRRRPVGPAVAERRSRHRTRAVRRVPRASSGAPDRAPPCSTPPRLPQRAARDLMTTRPPPRADLLDLAPVIPVVVIDDVDDAVPLARALAARRPAAHRGHAAHPRRRWTRSSGIAAEVPGMRRRRRHGHDARQVGEALAAGAHFLVSPGATDRLLAAVQASGVPFLPGVATVVGDRAPARARDQREMKLFPAEVSGGARS